jgi:site-specific DNA-methyltransferase (adenine-specific)
MVEMPTEAEPVRIVEGDCLDVLRQLPDGCADAVITDPPYGLGGLWAGGGGSSTKSSWNFDPKEAQSWDMKTAHEEVAAILSLGLPTVIWGGNYYSLPPSRCWFLWDKKQPDTWTTAQAEMAWTNIDRPVRVFRKAQCEVHDEMRPKEHPTQKPVSLMRWCIRMMRLPENAVILDPFAGSGTTGVAAAHEGRRAILIEKEPAYAAIARKRVAQCLDAGLFAEAG